MNPKDSKRIKYWIDITSWMSVVVATAGIFFAFRGYFESNTKTLITTSKSYEEIQTLQRQTAELQKENERLSKTINAIVFSETNQPTADISAQIAALRLETQTISKRLDDLDAAIMNSPEKALSVPLLRRDLDTLKIEYQKDIDSSGKQIDRIYDQNKWFIGLMFSMAIGLIGLAISNLIQARKKSE